MKSSALAKILESYARNSQDSAQEWAALAAIFAAAKAKPAADISRELGRLAQELPEEPRGVGALVPEARTMQATAQALGKGPFAAALEELRQLFEQHPGASVSALAAAMEALRPTPATRRATSRSAPKKDLSLIPAYNSRLEEALEDEAAFDQILSELKSEKRLGAAEIKKIAKLFAGAPAKSKDDALEAIRARQQSALDARAKEQFNTGRIAG